MKTQDVHISSLRQGDIILHNGELKTVSGTDLKRDKFMGTSVFGDSYHAGHKPVKKVMFR